jgi:hypothetical protein
MRQESLLGVGRHQVVAWVRTSAESDRQRLSVVVLTRVYDFQSGREPDWPGGPNEI